MIRSRNLTGTGRFITGSMWTMCAQLTAAAYHLAAGTNLNGIVAGGTPTGFVSFYMKGCQSLFLTPNIASGTATGAVFKITGENQFGENVNETVTLTGTTAQQSVLCYRRVTAFIVVSVTGGTFGATDTITLGYSQVNPRIPLMARITSAATVLAVKNQNQSSADTNQPTIRVVTVGANVGTGELPNMEIWNILLTGTATNNAGGTNAPAMFTVYLDNNDSQL